MSNPNGQTGITTAVLRGGQSPSGAEALPDAQVDYSGIPNCGVEHVVCGREVCRGLPGNLQTSPHN
jgi:hypothetical protein